MGKLGDLGYERGQGDGGRVEDSTARWLALPLVNHSAHIFSKKTAANATETSWSCVASDALAAAVLAWLTFQVSSEVLRAQEDLH